MIHLSNKGCKRSTVSVDKRVACVQKAQNPILQFSVARNKCAKLYHFTLRSDDEGWEEHIRQVDGDVYCGVDFPVLKFMDQNRIQRMSGRTWSQSGHVDGR